MMSSQRDHAVTERLKAERAYTLCGSSRATTVRAAPADGSAAFYVCENLAQCDRRKRDRAIAVAIMERHGGVSVAERVKRAGDAVLQAYRDDYAALHAEHAACASKLRCSESTCDGTVMARLLGVTCEAHKR